MKRITRMAVALVAIGSLMASPALAQRKTKGEVPGEEQFRSSVGYHTAVMEHCKQINKLAKSRGTFNVGLAREHSDEISRNLDAASRHQESYESAIGPDQRSVTATESATAATMLGQSKRLAGQLADVLKSQSADRKQVAATVTDLFLAQKDLVAAQKIAAKTLGISPASNPRKAGAAPKKSGAAARKPTKKSAGSQEVSATKKTAAR